MNRSMLDRHETRHSAASIALYHFSCRQISLAWRLAILINSRRNLYLDEGGIKMLRYISLHRPRDLTFQKMANLNRF